MEIRSSELKKTAAEIGVDLCGIASIDRFNEAPNGFHPCDVLPGCQSVIVLGSRFLNSTLEARSTIPYTIVRNGMTSEMDRLSIKVASWLESSGASAVPVGAIEPGEWDPATDKFRGIISLTHAAVLAGLGKKGKNTLLINDRYGNMIWLSAVLTTAVLEADPLAGYEVCAESCSLCLDTCPINALDGISMDQRCCADYAFGKHNGGDWRIKCFACRKICPNCKGIE